MLEKAYTSGEKKRKKQSKKENNDFTFIIQKTEIRVRISHT